MFVHERRVTIWTHRCHFLHLHCWLLASTSTSPHSLSRYASDSRLTRFTKSSGEPVDRGEACHPWSCRRSGSPCAPPPRRDGAGRPPRSAYAHPDPRNTYTIAPSVPSSHTAVRFSGTGGQPRARLKSHLRAHWTGSHDRCLFWGAHLPHGLYIGCKKHDGLTPVRREVGIGPSPL